jgi:hypothetical protein
VESKSSTPWFAPKKFGYGSGLPISWQGWVVFVLYLITVSIAPLIILFVPNVFFAVPAMVGVVVIATVALLVVCAKKTEGGWRWRWHGKP